MPAKELLSLRAYARHRKAKGLAGGTLSSVQAAINNERIPVVLEGGRKRIDPVAADAAWAANTRRKVDSKGEEEEAAAAAAAPAEGGAPSSAGLYSEARTTKEQAVAELKQLELAERRGELVRVDEVRRGYIELGRRLRNRLLAIPARVASQVAAARTAKEAEHILDEELRTALISFAEEEPGA